MSTNWSISLHDQQKINPQQIISEVTTALRPAEFTVEEVLVEAET